MKLKEYAEHINKLAKYYPDIQVVYSHDDEGNMFQAVYNEPSIGTYQENEFEEAKIINAICIN